MFSYKFIEELMKECTEEQQEELLFKAKFNLIAWSIIIVGFIIAMSTI